MLLYMEEVSSRSSCVGTLGDELFLRKLYLYLCNSYSFCLGGRGAVILQPIKLVFANKGFTVYETLHPRFITFHSIHFQVPLLFWNDSSLFQTPKRMTSLFLDVRTHRGMTSRSLTVRVWEE